MVGERAFLSPPSWIVLRTLDFLCWRKSAHGCFWQGAMIVIRNRKTFLFLWLWCNFTAKKLSVNGSKIQQNYYIKFIWSLHKCMHRFCDLNYWMWIVLHSGLQHIDCFVLCFTKLIRNYLHWAILIVEPLRCFRNLVKQNPCYNVLERPPFLEAKFFERLLVINEFRIKFHYTCLTRSKICQWHQI